MYTTIDFYGELTKANVPETYKAFKELLSAKLCLDPIDVDELLIYYFDEDKDKITISNEIDYKQAVFFMKNNKEIVIYAEIIEKSRLFKQNSDNPIDKIKKEIQEKERLLQDLVIRELAEKEEKEKRQREEKLQNTVEDVVNKILALKIDEIRTEIVKAALAEATKVVERASLPKKVNTAVHIGYQCNGCKASPIQGNRYSCSLCKDFDYCEECENKFYHTHKHEFVKIRNAEIKVIEKPKIVVDNDYKSELAIIRSEFVIHNISDEKIVAALRVAEGDIDKALSSLI